MIHNNAIKIIELNKSELLKILAVTKKIPEFKLPYSIEQYHARLEGKHYLILMAMYNNKPTGVKIGYQLEGNLFYSWVGGVLPEYRRFGIAKRLAEYQEDWLRMNRYTRLRMKTHNRFKSMLLFAIKNGFSVIGFIPKEQIPDHRIILEKNL